MTDEEIRKIWIALQDKDEWMRDSFLIALHTGCRLRETIIPMNCIDLAGETITFPAPKGGEEKAFSIPMPKALNFIVVGILACFMIDLRTCKYQYGPFLKSEAIEVSEVNLLQRPRLLPTITL
jgi:hypothetical protein